MEFKDILIVILIALMVSLGVGFYFNQPSDNLGGQQFTTAPNFRYGYRVAGTEVIDSSRNMTVSDLTASDDMTLGTASENLCMKRYLGGVAYYISFATTSGDGTFIATSTAPTGCP